MHSCFIRQNSKTRRNGALMRPIKKEKKQCAYRPLPNFRILPPLLSAASWLPLPRGSACHHIPLFNLVLADAGALWERRWRSRRAKPAPDSDTRGRTVLLFHSRTPRFETYGIISGESHAMFCVSPSLPDAVWSNSTFSPFQFASWERELAI